MAVRDEVAVIGVGCTRFGERFEDSWADLAASAVFEALGDAEMTSEEVDAAWLGSFKPWLAGERNAGTPLADALSLMYMPITLVSNICATGLDAFRNACFAVRAGAYDTVLAVGVEKMRDVESRSLSRANRDEGHPFYGKGRTAPGFFAMCANRYLETYGVDREMLAKVAVKNHKNGMTNPRAHLRREVTIEQVMGAPLVAHPLGVLDCTPTSDGAAAALVTTRERAESMGKDYVLVKGMGLAVGSERNVFDADFDYLGFQPTREAASQAYAEAGIREPRTEISMAEVHDCFTITEILNYEDLGFCGRGEGWKLVDKGTTNIDGDLPVNMDGGLKAFGHPIGASGLRMIHEIVLQLRGKAGARQVSSPRYGLAHTLGGPGALAAVVILGN